MTDTTLITLTGANQPNAEAQIMQGLAQLNIKLIDTQIANTNGHLVLGLRVAHEGALELSAITAVAESLGLAVQTTQINVEEQDAWLAQESTPAYIVTLMGREVTAQANSSVMALIAEHGLQVTSTKRLSAPDAVARVGYEFTVVGKLADAEALRKAFLAIAEALNVDVVLQEDKLTRRTSRIAVFDMDSTLIQAEVIDELAKAAGIGEQVIAITESAMRGEIDFNESFRRRVGLLKGLDASVLENIAQNLPITDGLEELMKNLKAQGYKTAILSGGFTYFAEHLKAKFGFDYIHANVLDIVDGKVTGEVKGEIVNGDQKAVFLRAIAEKEGVSLAQTVAVGDGANDLPMLSIAGLGVAFRAKPVVRERAKQAVTTLGLDGVLYLLGFQDKDLV